MSTGGWLDDYGPSNKINDGEDQIVLKAYTAVGLPGDTLPSGNTKTDTIKRYRYVGMTYDAAVTCRDEINDPPDLIAQLERENDAGAFMVTVAETVEGDWTPIE